MSLLRPLLHAGAKYVLPKFAYNTPNFLKGFYGGSKVASTLKGAARGLGRMAHHGISPRASAVFRNTGVSKQTQATLKRNMKELAAIYKEYPNGFPNSKNGRKYKQIANHLQKEIHGKIAYDKALNISYNTPSSLIDGYMKRHTDMELPLNLLPQVLKANRIKGGKTMMDMAKGDKQIADRILKAWQYPENVSGKILNFKATGLNTSLRDTQFSKQAVDFFKSINKSKNKFDFDEITRRYGATLNPLKDGRIEAVFSPARKGNYHWGGFNGRLVFNPKAKPGEQITVIASDDFNIFGNIADSITKRGMDTKYILNTMTPTKMKVPEIIEKAKKATKSKKIAKQINDTRKKSKKLYNQPSIPKEFKANEINFDDAVETVLNKKGAGKIFSQADVRAVGNIVKGYDDYVLTSKDVTKFATSRAVAGTGGLGLLNAGYKWMQKPDSSK